MQEGGAPIKYNTDGTIAIASQPREVRCQFVTRKSSALKTEFLHISKINSSLSTSWPSLTLVCWVNRMSVVPDTLVFLPLLTSVLCNVLEKFLQL